MIDWNSGRYLPGIEAWQFPGDVEILVAGRPDAPSSLYLKIAREVCAGLEQRRLQAASYLDYFVDRNKFARGEPWELESAEFGIQGISDNSRFNLIFRVLNDQYGLWKVAFHELEVPGPDHYLPVLFQRIQQ